MSTRGCVAIKRGDGWTGVYNHWDSYPTELGRKLWKHLKGVDLKLFAEELLKYDDWENYLVKGVCPYCGKQGLSQPHSIQENIYGRIPPHYGRNSQYSGARFETKKEMREHYKSFPWWFGRENEIENMIEEEWKMRQNIRRTGYVDPESKCHEHDPLEPAWLTNEKSDFVSSIEWVYVVDPETRTISIFTTRGFKIGDPIETKFSVRSKKGYFGYGDYVFKRVRVAKIAIDGEEPDWQLIENIIDAIPAYINLYGKTAKQDIEVLAEALKENWQLTPTKCIVCKKEVLAGCELAVHERCRLKTIKRLGGDTDAWKGKIENS